MRPTRRPAPPPGGRKGSRSPSSSSSSCGRSRAWRACTSWPSSGRRRSSPSWKGPGCCPGRSPSRFQRPDREPSMATQLSTDLANRIREKTGQNVFLCYQCVKCTSGCPLAQHFDLAPNQVMRAAQLGMEDLIFGSKTAWLCACCQTCTTRCPQGIDIAKVMDFIVSEAVEQGIQPQVPEAALFNKVFLRNVNILGRAYELGLIAEMNLRTGQPFKDVGMGLEMIGKGKVKLGPGFRRPAPPCEARAEEAQPDRLLPRLFAAFDGFRVRSFHPRRGWG